MQQVTAEVLFGASALARLAALAGSGEWQNLLFASRNATVFQHPSYVLGWYASHADHYEPVVVFGRTPTQRLAGLWLLARQRRAGRLVQAGHHHSAHLITDAQPDAERVFIATAQRALAVALGVPAIDIGTVPMPPRELD